MPLTSIRNRRWLPWSAPAVAAIAVAAVAWGPQAFASNPHPQLPARTPAQLIAAVEQTSVHAFSGTISSTPDLGLPKLPGADGANQLSALLTAPATWSLAVSGPERQRVALLGTGEEMDVVHNGSTVWTWDSTTQSATRYLLPARSGEPADNTGGAADPSPIALAQQLLRSVRPTTRVTVGPTTIDAGRSAYTLVVAPRTTQTLIGRAVIDIDSASGMPLGVTLYPRGSSTAALSEKFTSLTLRAPSSSTFVFTPPPGATVHVHTAADHPAAGSAKPATPAGHAREIGQGWAAVAVLHPGAGGSAAGLQKMLAGAASGHSPAALLQDATNPGPDGSRLLQTRLATVMLTAKGTVLAGAVPASRLEAVARQLGA